MGGSINKIGLIIITLIMPFTGYNQGVFNESFDTLSAANASLNALQFNDEIFFSQVVAYNGFDHIQVITLDSFGIQLRSNNIVKNSNSLFMGFPGSFQSISSNEFCQLYHIGPDSGINIVFFDSNLAVIRDKRYDFGYFLNAGIVKQMDDSTLLTLGRIQNSTTYDLFLINTDLQGNERWRTILGEPGKNDYGFAIEYFNDKILVSGTTENEGAHLFELDMNGIVNFDTIYSNLYWGTIVKYHPNFGLYFLVAQNNSSTGYDYSSLLKLDANYHIEWQQDYFRGDNSYLQQMAINDQGTLSFAGGLYQNNVFTGLFFQANHLGDSLGSKLIDHIAGERAQFHDIRPTNDGGYIMAGETRAPGQDSWIVKVNAWGCDNIPCIVSVNEPEISQGELNCYPNPTNGFGTISGSLSTMGEQSEIKVFNSIGQLIQTIPITQKDFEVHINLTRNGLYLVNLYQGNELVQSRKWVVR